jgi:hypothetical protein
MDCPRPAFFLSCTIGRPALTYNMSKPGLVVLLFFLSGRALSQDYFVFIGSDHRQPFYVRIDSQVYSSTAAGHLLLAPLRDSSYLLAIGFPGQTYPEQRFSFSIRGKDREFGLRQQGDGSWRLYDEIGKDWVTMLQKEISTGTPVQGVKKDDAFSRMMAGVVHDTAVLYNTYAMEEGLKDSPVVKKAAVVPSDSANAGNAGRIPDSVAQLTRVDAEGTKVGNPESGGTKASPSQSVRASDSARQQSGVPRRSKVVKVSEKKSAGSVKLVYADSRDTIVVIIPRDSADAAPVIGVTKTGKIGLDKAGKGRADTTHKSGIVKAGKPGVDTVQKAGIDISRMTGVDTAGKIAADAGRKTGVDTARRMAADSTVKASKGIAFINSDCHNYATDIDVDRLRVKMMDAGSDDDRIVAARKVFKTRCFYTPQIRALSEVFSSDAGKFRFFEAAWPFAADEHFGELSILMTDPVYIGKFRTMTGGQP